MVNEAIEGINEVRKFQKWIELANIIKSNFETIKEEKFKNEWKMINFLESNYWTNWGEDHNQTNLSCENMG
jgi:hypothetical protein